MKYKLIIAVAAVVLMAAGCNKATEQQSADNSTEHSDSQGIAVGEPNPSTPSGQTPTTQNPNGETKDNQKANADVSSDVTDMPEVVEVKITSTGFSPATVTIRKGDYVQFTNTDSANHWPASDPHPTHTGYPGFDALKALTTGQNYRFQFEKVGSWGYHDHLNPSHKGIVVVK